MRYWSNFCFFLAALFFMFGWGQECGAHNNLPGVWGGSEVRDMRIVFAIFLLSAIGLLFWSIRSRVYPNQ
jgi:hypothetical protein